MTPIQPTINLGDTGKPVANLRAALLFLLEKGALKPSLELPTDVLKKLWDGVRDEQANNAPYDTAASQVVLWISVQHGLGAQFDGQVEVKTAELLNRLLREYGGLVEPMAFAVKGRVLRGDSAEPQAGVRVRAFAASAAGESKLGDAESNAGGIYRIEFVAPAVDIETLVVRALRPDGSEMGAAKRAGAPDTEMVLDIVVAADTYLVRGRVTDTRGRPMAGLKVVAFDRDLRRHQRLGDAATDADGAYAISYRPELFQRAEGNGPQAADLFVLVLPANSQEPLVTSPTRFQAKPVETIDLVVPAVDDEPPEFERVMASVMPLLAGQGKPQEVHHVPTDPISTDLLPQELDDTDLEFIVGDTGLDEAAVRAWIVGARLQAQALQLLGDSGQQHRSALQALGWAFGHAWQRINGIGTLAGMLASGQQMWEAALDRGAVQRWIAALEETQRKALLAALGHLQQLATADPKHSTDPLVPKIATYLGGVPPTMAADLLRLFREQGDPGLEKSLDLGGGDPKFQEPLTRLVRSIRVHDLAEGHEPLIPPLMARFPDGATGLNDLLSLQLGDWQALTGQALAGSPDAGGLAYRMLAAVEQQAPAQALLTRLEQGAIVPKTGGADDLLGVVAGNQAAVERVMKGGLEQDEVQGFVTEFPGHARYLSDLGIYSKVGIDLAHGSRLLDTGFSISGWLTSYGKGKPFGAMQPEGPLGQSLPPEVMKVLGDIAARFKGDAEKLFSFDFGQVRVQRQRFADDPTPDTGAPPAPPVEGISSPTVRGMFGDLDSCVCRPCESVLGPGAYLVDLLRALQLEVSVQPAGDGLSLLLDRRPDVLDLDLSCENAEVLVPHIDLALEQLEWLAAKPDLSFVQTDQRPVSDWLGPPIDPAVRTLLQQTTDHTIDTVLTSKSKLGLWLVQEGNGGRSWWMAPEDAGPNGCCGWRVVGMAIRRSAALPDPRVAPAERNPKAYQALMGPGAVYPWALPFDAAEVDKRVLFDALQIDPLLLGPILPSYDAAQRLDRDTLRLSAAETALLVNPRMGDALWKAWGFADDSPLPTIDDPASGATIANGRPSGLLTYASFLLARSGLALEELELALATDFVGGYVLSNREQCQTSLMQAQRGTALNRQFIDAAGLDRLHRLTRLWRKLPEWPLPTLDSALRSMKSGPGAPAMLGDEHLRLLAAMQRARLTLGIAPDQLLALRLPLADVSRPGAGGTESVFSAAFLGHHVPADARDAFNAALRGQANPPAWATWQAQAAAAIGMPAAQAVLPASAFPTAALTVDTLSWLSRHRVLAGALGRPIGELLILLQWRGWGAGGLGAAGDPLGATPSLAQRAADFDRLAQLRAQASTLADLDLPVQVLAASQMETLQQRGTTTPQPPGARTSEALQADLLSLRAKLAAVADPPALPKPGTYREVLTNELVALSWDPVLVEQLGAELMAPPANGLSSEVETLLLKQQTPLPDPQPLLSAEELKALLRLEPSADARLAFLLDRLTERRRLRELQVAERLTLCLGGKDGRALLAALRSADTRQRKEAAARLAEGDMQRRSLGQPQPLLEPGDADRLANAEVLDSWRSRLDLIDARLATREREAVLLNEVMAWAQRHGVDWSSTAAEGFLTDRLTLRGASGALAREALLAHDFRRSQSAAPPAALQAWATQLDTALALRAHSPVAAALQDLPGLDWRGLLDPADAAGREPLPQLLWLADANRLGLPTLALLFDPAATKERVLAGLAQRVGLAPDVIEALAVRAATLTGAQTLLPSHLRHPAALWRLWRLAEPARRLAATGPQLDALLGAQSQASLDTARALLAGLTGAREWPRQLRRLNDASRIHRRDALVAHLVHQLQLRDADALFERMLIDPLVQPCMDTTRLKQATAAVQMLVQRALEGLEPGAQASDKLRQQWSWMHAYRLWEANRKVFLYPENWLLPELRDDKSPEFKKLEASLLEDETTPNRANQAFGCLLDDIEWMTQAEPVGLCEDADIASGRSRELYVLGQAPNVQSKFYWRRCRDFGQPSMEWSPWESIELEINSRDATLFMVAKRPVILWIDAKQRQTGVMLRIASFDGQTWGRVQSVALGWPVFLDPGDAAAKRSPSPLIAAMRVLPARDGLASDIDLFALDEGGSYEQFAGASVSARGVLSARSVQGGALIRSSIPNTELGRITGLMETLQIESPSNFGLQLFRPTDSGSNIPVVVFEDSGDDTFQLVPASSPSVQELIRTRVWHFSERPIACYIDVASASTSGGDGMTLFPDGVSPASGVALRWRSNGEMPSGSSQANSFGTSDWRPLGHGTTSSGLPESWKPVFPSDTRAGARLFDLRFPNACYEWEIYFHAPLAMADQLTRQQRFQDADRWLRMVFDPLTSSDADPQAFLRFRRFRSLPRAVGAASDLKALAKRAATQGAASPSVARVQQAIDRWRSQPFRPYVIARQRHVAFLWRTLFAYIENLLAWADSLYRRETRESIQEAVLKYVQVARLLGPRPRRTRAVAVRPAASFVDYLGAWDEFANLWLREVRIERKTPVTVTVEAADDHASVEGLLFFCLPPNERLIGYWDIVEQRLRNIRHCRTIDGVERTLPIEAPEINLDELIRSVAAGGTPEDFLAESFAQPWPYRYPTLLAQAKELVSDVKALGAQLLAALEKRDSELLAQLRSTHELAMLERVTEVRTLHIDEAERQVQSLRTSREAIAARYEQLQRQLGKEGVQAPQIHQSAGTESPLGRLSSGNAHAPSNLGLITEEVLQLEQLHYANWWIDADSVARLVAWGFNAASAAAGFASVFEQPLPPLAGSTPSEKAAKALGALGSAASATADGFRAIAQIHQTQASRLGQSASNIRRRDEWAFQSNQALRELATIDKQIAAAEAREAVVRKELANHELQREQSAATDTYLREKFTGAALYQWQSGQLLALYRSSYGLALALARRALQAAERELGETLPPIRGRWSAAHSGLLAGEHLQRELKSLELSVLERNTREEEATRHVSLRRLDPRALVDLIANRSCEFEVPEWLFDLDAPGHYLRRIKMVSVSVPCVTGPQASINARLTLLRSDTRVSSLVGTSYPRNPDGDERFETRFHAGESIFISSGREDSGLFETSLRDERYLPFEGAGAVSRWRIEFPSDVAQFDRTTISDVVLHLRYTAREGGTDLRREATKQFSPGAPQPQLVLLSARTDFATEWAQARQSTTQTLRVALDATYWPYWMTRPAFNFRFSELQTWDLDGAGALSNPVSQTVAPAARILADLGSVSSAQVDRLILATLTASAPA